MSRVRLFTGIELPSDVIAALVAVKRAIRQEVPSWREEKWVAEQNLHVTLKFIGDVEQGEVEGVRAALSAVAPCARSFVLEATGVRAVPSAGRAAMLWATFDDPGTGGAWLASALGCALEPWGVEEDKRPFSAHATLVRARRQHAFPQGVLSSLAEPTQGAVSAMSVSTFTLFSSTLMPSGPVYEVVERWTLSEPAMACDR